MRKNTNTFAKVITSIQNKTATTITFIDDQSANLSTNNIITTDNLGTNPITITAISTDGKTITTADSTLNYIPSITNLDIIITKANWSSATVPEQVMTFGTFDAGTISTDTSRTSFSLVSSGSKGFFTGVAGRFIIFSSENDPVDYLNDVVGYINDPTSAPLSAQAANFFQFTAELVNETQANITLRLTPKTNINWLNSITQTATSNIQPGFSSSTLTRGIGGSDIFLQSTQNTRNLTISPGLDIGITNSTKINYNNLIGQFRADNGAFNSQSGTLLANGDTTKTYRFRLTEEL